MITQADCIQVNFGPRKVLKFSKWCPLKNKSRKFLLLIFVSELSHGTRFLRRHVKTHNITDYPLRHGKVGKEDARRLGLPHSLSTIVFQLILPPTHKVLYY